MLDSFCLDDQQFYVFISYCFVTSHHRLVVKTNTQLLSAHCGWLLCSDFHKAESNMSARLSSLLETLRKTLLPSSFKSLGRMQFLEDWAPCFLTCCWLEFLQVSLGPCPMAPSIFRAGEYFDSGKYFLLWTVSHASDLSDFCLWSLHPDLKDLND